LRSWRSADGRSLGISCERNEIVPLTFKYRRKTGPKTITHNFCPDVILNRLSNASGVLENGLALAKIWKESEILFFLGSYFLATLCGNLSLYFQLISPIFTSLVLPSVDDEKSPLICLKCFFLLFLSFGYI